MTYTHKNCGNYDAEKIEAGGQFCTSSDDELIKLCQLIIDQIKT